MTNRIATANIERWIDGDTLVVYELDPGWGVVLKPTHPSDVRCHVRLAYVNTPDTRKNARWYDPVLAKAATEFVNTKFPVGTPVVLESFGFDNFGRTIATVTDPSGADIGSTLVAAGYARLGDEPIPIPEETHA